VPADDPAAAENFLTQVLSNVTVMDKAARDSVLNFEKGIGDLAITYENEVLVGRQSGQKYELVLPTSTILIENPVAVVDASVDKHGTRVVAQAFVDFLYSPQAQEIYAQHGLRVVDPGVAAENGTQYPPIDDLFTIEFFGGWSQAIPDIFGENGVYTQAILQVQTGAQ
jgi:sulfate transport system substrate-binding protein